MSAAVQLLGTFPPVKSVLEMHHFSGGTSGIHGGGVKFRQHKQGEGSALGRCLERSSSSGRFWPRSSTTELPRASPTFAEIKQKSVFKIPF